MKYNCEMKTPHGPASVVLSRAPMFLRFVYRPQSDKRKTIEWDALDLLTDEVRRGEEVLVGIRNGIGDPYHLLCGRMKGGRSATGWYRNVEYFVFESQPPREVARNNERWQEWAVRERDALLRKVGAV